MRGLKSPIKVAKEPKSNPIPNIHPVGCITPCVFWRLPLPTVSFLSRISRNTPVNTRILSTNEYPFLSTSDQISDGGALAISASIASISLLISSNLIILSENSSDLSILRSSTSQVKFSTRCIKLSFTAPSGSFFTSSHIFRAALCISWSYSCKILRIPNLSSTPTNIPRMVKYRCMKIRPTTIAAPMAHSQSLGRKFSILGIVSPMPS